MWGFNLLNLTIGGEGAHGWIPTDDFKKNIALALSKPVMQYDLNGNFLKIWSSQLEASKFYKVRSSAIGHALKNPEVCAVNYLWRRFDTVVKKIKPYTKFGNKNKLIVEDIKNNVFITYKSNMNAFKIIGRPTMPSDYINKNKVFRKQYKLYRS